MLMHVSHSPVKLSLLHPSEKLSFTHRSHSVGGGGGGLRVDPAVARHCNHFHQFDAGAPIGNAHRRSVWRASVAKLMAAAAQSDDHVRLRLACDLQGAFDVVNASTETLPVGKSV